MTAQSHPLLQILPFFKKSNDCTTDDDHLSIYQIYYNQKSLIDNNKVHRYISFFFLSQNKTTSFDFLN